MKESDMPSSPRALWVPIQRGLMRSPTVIEFIVVVGTTLAWGFEFMPTVVVYHGLLPKLNGALVI